MVGYLKVELRCELFVAMNQAFWDNVNISWLPVQHHFSPKISQVINICMFFSKSKASKPHDFQTHRFLGTLGAHPNDASAVFIAMNQPFKKLWTGAKMSRLFFCSLRRRRPNHDIAPLFFASGWGQQFLEDFWLCPITHLAFCNHTQRQHQLHQKRSIFSFFTCP